jgi:hypothetical protein
MVYFQTKNSNWGKYLRALYWKIYILLPFGIFYIHPRYFMTIWYILCSFGTLFSGFGITHQEKSGNPDTDYLHACSFQFRDRAK